MCWLFFISLLFICFHYENYISSKIIKRSALIKGQSVHKYIQSSRQEKKSTYRATFLGQWFSQTCFTPNYTTLARLWPTIFPSLLTWTKLMELKSLHVSRTPPSIVFRSEKNKAALVNLVVTTSRSNSIITFVRLYVVYEWFCTRPPPGGQNARTLVRKYYNS